MKAKSTVEAEVDVARNILRMRFAGVVTSADLQAALIRVAALLQEMRTGFATVTDLSNLEVMELECAPHIAKMMDLFLVRGVGKVVRLIPDPHKDIGFNILSATHYRGTVQVITCDTSAEVERALS